MHHNEIYSRRKVLFGRKFIELKPYSAVQRVFRSKWRNTKAPHHNTIKDLYDKFKKTGSLINVTRTRLPDAERREKAQILIENLVSEFPKLSSRQVAKSTGTSTKMTLDIMRREIDWYPYKIQAFHRLLAPDLKKRVDFAEWFFKTLDISHGRIICTDEAYFYLTEPLNKQNNRIWASEKPQGGIERPLHDQKVLVFCTISAVKVYGPYFFSESVNQHNYLTMLKD